MESRRLHDILDDLNKTIYLPHIQRPFVWGEDQVRKLLDSLLREYPIQTLLFWRTREEINRDPAAACNPVKSLQVKPSGPSGTPTPIFCVLPPRTGAVPMRDRWKSVGPLGGGADGRFVLDSGGLTLPGPFAGSLFRRPPRDESNDEDQSRGRVGRPAIRRATARTKASREAWP